MKAKLTKVSKTEVSMTQYKAQTTVRRTFNHSCSYNNIAVMVDADCD